jgi:hypothetical protein
MLIPIDHKVVGDLSKDIMDAIKKRSEFFQLSQKFPSRIANAIRFEGGVHVVAVGRLIVEVTWELQKWAIDHPSGHGGGNYAEHQWSLAVGALQEFLSVIKVDNTKAFLKVGYAILNSLAALSGVETVKSMFEALKAAQEAFELAGIQRQDGDTTAETLSEIELVATSFLIFGQFVVGQAWALTRSHSVDLAKSRIVDEIHAVRQEWLQQLSKAEMVIRFPADGMWPGETA